MRTTYDLLPGREGVLKTDGDRETRVGYHRTPSTQNTGKHESLLMLLKIKTPFKLSEFVRVPSDFLPGHRG